MSNNEPAYKYLCERGVTRLCHFTKIKSLTHILTEGDGILATEFIPITNKQQNDKDRLDGCLEYVCCSLQYPNGWYWAKAKSRDEDEIFKEWAVISISLEVLAERSFKFCQCNAAKGHGAYIKTDAGEIYELFNQRTVQGRSRDSSMLSCCPTDDQAEILVYKNVPLKYINGIIVGDESRADYMTAILRTTGSEIPVYISKPFFADIRTSMGWSQQVRRGEIPVEIQYNY